MPSARRPSVPTPDPHARRFATPDAIGQRRCRLCGCPAPADALADHVRWCDEDQRILSRQIARQALTEPRN